MEEIGIESSFVEAIRIGEKTIEGLLGKPRFLAIQEGEDLSIREDVWKDGEIVASYEDVLRVQVTQKLYFETFKEMLEAVNYEAVIPTAQSLEQAVDAYAEFYSAKDQEEYGVVALFFDVIE